MVGAIGQKGRAADRIGPRKDGGLPHVQGPEVGRLAGQSDMVGAPKTCQTAEMGRSTACTPQGRHA